MMVAACVAPTDPILAQAVVGGPWAEKHVPAHIRHILQCESGCNDGAAFPFLFLAYFLTVNRGQVGFPIAKWFYQTIAWEICLGTFIGAVVGYCARKLIRFSERYKLADRESFVVNYVSLAIASAGGNVLLGSDDLLAAFACGTAFAWDGWFQRATADSHFSNIIDLLFNVGTFIYIGALMPWHDFTNGDINLSLWRLIVLSILVLLLKRIPIVVMLWKYIPDIKTFHEAIFAGYFGPMGVGAIFICTYGRLLLPEHVPYPPVSTNDVLAHTIQPIVYFFVLASVIVHGFTVPFFAFGRRAQVNLQRTLTQQSNINFTLTEPSWLSGLRRTMTSQTVDAEVDTNQTSVVKAMHEGLKQQGGRVARPEDEDTGIRIHDPETFNREQDKSVSFAQFGHEGVPHFEPEEDSADFSEGDDWGGIDTVEARKAREEMARRNEKDITEASRSQEHEYPMFSEWIEGNYLVVETQEHEFADPETTVIHLNPEDAKEIEESLSPLAWTISRYEDRIKEFLGWSEKKKSVSELSFKQILDLKILPKLSHWSSERKKQVEEAKQLKERTKHAADLEIVRVHPNGKPLE